MRTSTSLTNLPSVSEFLPSPAPGDALAGRDPTVFQKLLRKVARNRELGWTEFLEKGARFARSAAASHFHLRAVASLGVGVRITGRPPVIERPAGTIVLGDDLNLEAPVTAIHFAVRAGAHLEIGACGWINDGAWFGCTERIIIGRRVLIGPGVRVFDNDYHDALDRYRMPPACPVTIGDDVWIATGATVLAGVTIGRGAIVGAGSVVRGEIAPFTVVAGNPARVVRTLDPERFVAPRWAE
jgi:maltose O-acetyltransferase